MDLNKWHQDLIKEDIENNISDEERKNVDNRMAFVLSIGCQSDESVEKIRNAFLHDYDLLRYKRQGRKLVSKLESDFKNEGVRSFYRKVHFISDRFNTAELYYCILKDWHNEFNNVDSILHKFGMFDFAVYTSLILSCSLEIYKIYDAGSNGGNIAAIFEKFDNVHVGKIIHNESVLAFNKARIDNYKKEYDSMSSILDELKKYRDKIWAHNDVKKKREEIMRDCPIYVDYIDKLYGFAYRFIRYLLTCLSYDFHYRNIVNTHDVDNLKRCLEQGLKRE